VGDVAMQRAGSTFRGWRRRGRRGHGGKKMGLGYHIRISESGKKTNLLIMKEKINIQRLEKKRKERSWREKKWA